MMTKYQKCVGWSLSSFQELIDRIGLNTYCVKIMHEEREYLMEMKETAENILSCLKGNQNQSKPRMLTKTLQTILYTSYLRSNKHSNCPESPLNKNLG